MFNNKELVFDDDREAVEGEPWITAGEIIENQGVNAELFVIQLASRLMAEGKITDAKLVGRVFKAIVLMRATGVPMTTELAH